MGDTEIWTIPVGDGHEMLLLRAIGDRWPRAALLLGVPGAVGRVNQGLLRKLSRDAFAHPEPPNDAGRDRRGAFLELLLELSQAIPDSPEQPQAPATKEHLRSLVADLARIVEEMPESDPQTDGPAVIDAGGWEQGRWLMRTSAIVGPNRLPIMFFLVPFRPQGFEGPSSNFPAGSITARPISADGRLVTTKASDDAIGVQLPGMSAWITARRLESVLDFIADDEALRVAASLAALRARLDGRSPTAAYNGLLAGRFKFPQETSTEIHRRMRLVSRALRNDSDREELAFLAPPGIDIARLTEDVLRLEPDVMAENHYMQNGWRIVARNVFNGRGKIDFIAENDDGFVVCEIKTAKPSEFTDVDTTMTALQLWARLGQKSRASAENVRGAALDWAEKNGVSLDRLRFDVALVLDDSVTTVPNAF